MNNLKSLIKQSRPNLKDSSIKTYITNINKLAKEIGIKEIKDYKFLDNAGQITKVLMKKKSATQKTYLATIIVILKALEAKKNLIEYYTEKMNKLIEEHDKVNFSQVKSEKQEKNWIPLPDLKKEVDRQGREITRMRLWNKNKLTPLEFDQIQKYVVGALYLISDDNPPIRADYSDMKKINKTDYDKLNDKDLKNNYLVNVSKSKKYFHLGDFKTQGKYGNKQIEVGKKLNTVLNKWNDVNKSEYLLINNRKQPMSANSLSKFINRIFFKTGKNININLMRHIYVSTKFPAQNNEKAIIANKMMHSIEQQTEYSKK